MERISLLDNLIKCVISYGAKILGYKERDELRRIQLIFKVNFGIGRTDYITLEGIKN